ncbi:hypothetical protein MHYP_G00040110 [Metynnis hypsauchen]
MLTNQQSLALPYLPHCFACSFGMTVLQHTAHLWCLQEEIITDTLEEEAEEPSLLPEKATEVNEWRTTVSTVKAEI